MEKKSKNKNEEKLTSQGQTGGASGDSSGSTAADGDSEKEKFAENEDLSGGPQTSNFEGINDSLGNNVNDLSGMGDLPLDEKKRIAEMMQEQLLSSATKPDRRFAGCLKVITLLFMLFFVSALVIILWSVDAIQKGVFSDSPFPSVSVQISKKEKERLDLMLKKYEEVVKEERDDPRGREFKMVLSKDQVNYLMQSLPKNDDFAYLQIYPEGEKSRIYVSIIMGEKKYINAIFDGKPFIRDYVFYLRADSIKIGKMKNAAFTQERLVKRINRGLEQAPRAAALPFRIKDMEIQDSKIYLTLRIIEN